MSLELTLDQQDQHLKRRKLKSRLYYILIVCASTVALIFLLALLINVLYSGLRVIFGVEPAANMTIMVSPIALEIAKI